MKRKRKEKEADATDPDKVCDKAFLKYLKANFKDVELDPVGSTQLGWVFKAGFAAGIRYSAAVSVVIETKNAKAKAKGVIIRP